MNLNLNSVETSPITGNTCVYTEPDENYGYIKLCMESGYQYMQGYVSGSEQCFNYEQVCPKIVTDSKIIDEEDRVWYKTVYVTPYVILYPETDGWVVTTMRTVEEGEQLNSVVTLIVGEEVMVIDDAHALHFGELDFGSALNSFYKLLNLSYERAEA